jgi:hypothetical protein
MLSESLESINKSIISKIKCLYKICNTNKLYNIIEKLDKVYDTYLISVIDIFSQYYNNYGNTNLIYNYTILYKNRINVINITNKIELLFYLAYNYIIHTNSLTPQAKVDIFNFTNNSIYSNMYSFKNKHQVNTENERCYCNNKYIININNNELICPTCGKIYFNNQIVIHNSDDRQLIKYDFLRHYKIWLDKILAIDEKYIHRYENDIIKLEKKIYKDYPLEQQRNKLNITHIRSYLKSLNLTKLNDIVPILLKRITKTEPPRLNTNEYTDLENIFIQVTKVYDSIKPSNEINRKYYPYFIYKIIEHYFKNSSIKQLLLNNIHLQKKKTLVTNDLRWKKICEKLPFIEYTETIDKLY